MVLPAFLRDGIDQNENDFAQSQIDDSDEHIPTNQEAEHIFGSVKSSSSLFSNAKSSSSLFQDLTNQEKLRDDLDFDDHARIKRTSLTKADLIDLPSPPKIKRMSPPKTSIV